MLCGMAMFGSKAHLMRRPGVLYSPFPGGTSSFTLRDPGRKLDERDAVPGQRLLLGFGHRDLLHEALVVSVCFKRLSSA